MRRALLIGAVVVAGCGSQAEGGDPVVRVYVSEQLRGSGGASNEIVLAEQMALQEAGGRAGRFRVELKVLDESSEKYAVPPSVLENTRRATADPRAVAFLGNATSGATAAAIPETRKAGLLHVSTASTNVGLVEPGGTFARVIPDDAVQAAAMVEYMRREGVRRTVVFGDETLFGRELCAMVKSKLQAAGIEDAETPEITRQYRSPAGLGKALAAAEVDAFAYCGGVPGNVVTTFAEAAPGVKVFLADVAFGTGLAQEGLGEHEQVVHITGPAADAPQAKDFMTRFEKRFGAVPDPQVLGGYETMKAVLAAIERAGERGDERKAVRDAFFATERRESVMGPYRIQRDGSASIDRYGLYRVRDRKIVPAGTVTVKPEASR